MTGPVHESVPRGGPAAGAPAWSALYREGQPHAVEPEFENLVDMVADAVRRHPDQDAIRWFDATISVRELDALAAALGAALHERGIVPGDRVALFSQNHPAFVIGMLAAWELGCVAVSVNPMYKHRELAHVLVDSGARVIICLDELLGVVGEVLAAGEAPALDVVVSSSSHDLQSRGDDRALPAAGVPAVELPQVLRLLDLVDRYRGERPVGVPPARGGDPAFLVYTSGTTGDPKGARLTHSNLVVNARNYREWMELGADDVILAVAPLFHITGLVGHGVLSLLLPAPLVLGHRFHPEVMVELVREHRPTFTVGAITAFVAMAGVEGVGADDFASLTKVYSGGAPIAPTVADELEGVLGAYVHNAYGLTETSSITHVVPPHRRAPVDPVSGALSIGVPIASVAARVVGEDGRELPPGEPGELLLRGPQVADGYWGRPDATAASFPDGELRTGDIAFVDEAGWFYLVDRKKDMIIASGYKVWPREVEEVLHTHPAVREAAVIGVPDGYRGETVHAFVSLRTGSRVEPDELVVWCRERMAAYKYPREVVVLDELPKTASGKVLRRSLRKGT